MSNVKNLIDRDSRALDNEISQTIQEIKDLDSQAQYINSTITAKVQHLAELMEEKMQRAGTPEFVFTICSMIIRMFKSQRLGHRADTVLKALPDRYKDLKKSSSHLTDTSAKPTEESSILFEQIRAASRLLRDPHVLTQFTRAQLQDLASDALDVESDIVEFCDDNNVEVLSSNDSHDWQDELNKNKPPPISLDKAPDAINSPRDDAKEWFRLATLCQKMGQARMDYPWTDMKDVHEEANAVRAICNMIEPCINRKYRYDPRQMNAMIFEAVDQSGTAAASHSGVICAKSINPKTGLPELRRITKEQLDAICLPFYNRMNQVIEYAPHWGQVIKKAYDHFEGYDATYLAQRAKEVGPKLQRIK